ncbi:MAG: dephospho-CoA kinase [Chloroflexi bacterium]|nr:dephospho-CoA kinase [Chloroflexota bacterium]
MSERYPDKYLIGLTGNIAVGKSLVRDMLSELGAATIDADHVAHQVIRKGEAAYERIIEAFGAGILDSDGEILRAALGEIVFADPARLKQLEGITHPAIRRRIDQRIRDAEARVTVIEAIKLLEGELKNAVDSVWVVDASPRTQRQRLISARGLSPAEAERRITLQNSQADKLRQADIVIRNDGDARETRAQVAQAWRKLPVRTNEL